MMIRLLTAADLEKHAPVKRKCTRKVNSNVVRGARVGCVKVLYSGSVHIGEYRVGCVHA